jgi:hypothetical protein
MAKVIDALAKFTKRAVKELKDAEEWDGHEERINNQFTYEPENIPSGEMARAIVLIILRAESPEVIPVWFEMNTAIRKSIVRANIEEIKKQIKTYFTSETHHKCQQPKIFTIKEVLRDYPKISNWLYGIE